MSDNIVSRTSYGTALLFGKKYNQMNFKGGASFWNKFLFSKNNNRLRSHC
jgi:hypothetical protein